MKKEEYNASPYMQKFFANLFEIKEFVKQKSEEKKDRDLEEVYQRLDKVIKKGVS